MILSAQSLLSSKFNLNPASCRGSRYDVALEYSIAELRETRPYAVENQNALSSKQVLSFRAPAPSVLQRATSIMMYSGC